jgi:predicted nuclease of predicted toxin-antitoxin system
LTVLRFRIDENVPVDAATMLRSAQYDCDTVYDERLAGASDSDVASACQAEERVLITLDLDFSDVRAYAPGTHSGIIVLRPRSADRDHTLALLRRVLALLGTEPLAGALWIVDCERVRVRARHVTGQRVKQQPVRFTYAA